ncbi:zinc finger protein 217 isoform X2 [Dermochelys coriacea]|uniref:zinc finger protein 217 isoform X2 n=1 Tax=Dermochelys coriacea TaxID=27794 RepID=UPI001CA8D559|nr:zinc finger protein 217 isoform X2 [Dermochelys coriacea]XP_043352134.1 zinc finger protein 217 isoform X2 [Dermochelys coriacea]XP_043352137.1 zinc finger protein 217 isoform X2 [Dermochelys coriacea]XP_043352138.1 zinc finger protein 217 isoform X2 [Dermochelys coriacea]
MPTQPLLVYMDGPDGIASTVGVQMENNDASMPIKGTNTISYKNMQEKFLMQAEGCMPLDCMFCDQTFKHPEELGKHVLTQHRPTLCEPAVLRVEAEYISPLDKCQVKTNLPSPDNNEKDNEEFSCDVCGQTFGEAFDVETHMKKHKDSFTYWCNVCGRRFKEPWFLKNHMRTHTGKPGSRNKLQQGSESPVTINEVVQEHVNENVTSPYKICMVCGFLFLNKENLIEHSKVHTKESASNGEGANKGGLAQREEFLQFLNLRPNVTPEKNRSEKPVKWIAELDPFNTYQAWQLATKGKVAVGHGQIKEPGQEGSTDNDDSSSDKEELGEIWNTNKGSQVSQTESTGKSKVNKSSSCPGNGTLSQDKQKHPNGEVPSMEMDPKLSQNKEKPTHCSECGKAFRTYHQLVLHSRVHKRERRTDAETSATSRTYCADLIVTLHENGVVDRTEGGSEDGSEDGLPDTLHLGEKPYKCEFCEYAAAQKTSLRYHLERHHKEKQADIATDVKSDSKVLLQSQEMDLLQATDGAQETKNLKRFIDCAKDAKGCPPVKQQKEILSSFQSILGGPVVLTMKNDSQDLKGAVRNSSNQMNENSDAPYLEKLKAEGKAMESQANDPIDKKERDALVTLEGDDIQLIGALKDINNVEEMIESTEKCKHKHIMSSQEKPLNLSIGTVQECSVISTAKGLLATSTCPFCTYRTFYPEVLMIHQRLMHKYNPDTVNKNGYRNKALAKARRTGCPPALLGKDVLPLSLNPNKSKASLSMQPKQLHTEKTKQCPPLQSKVPVFSTVDPSCSAPSNLKSYKPQSIGAQASSCRQPQQDMHSNPSISSVMDRVKKAEPKAKTLNISASQPGVVSSSINSSYDSPLNESAWFSNRGREYLCNRSVGHINLEFGEPSSKRVKPNLLALEHIDSARINYRRYDVSRSRVANRYANLLPQECSHAKPASSVLPTKQELLNSDEADSRNVLTILKTYEPYSSGSLYGSFGPSNGQATSSPIEGKRPVSYQHLSNSMLQKRSYESFIGNARFRPNDKKT